MEANKTVLQMKYARIVNLFAKETGMSLEDMHYLSSIVPLHTSSSVKELPISIAAVTNI